MSVAKIIARGVKEKRKKKKLLKYYRQFRFV